ncbi:AEC family transporter [Siculibacillus lacustris]|uniref:AEC family transporter n=1 Tax=Siculibacillus lacustris TaxID=1549641 RepID=A0A4Q9VUU5_9HYPH|nr:AEC family transporter [Siculibacillus lacustris]TBW39466.1 AEC family transporter [Siculibacillus lacustris]
MLLISSLAAVIAPAFLISLIGFVWAKRGLPFDQTMITHLMTMVAAPSLVFSIFTKMHLPLADVATMAAATILCMLIFGVVGAIGLRLAGLSARVFLPSLIFPNVGNMGLPVCFFAFGDAGMTLAMVYFAVSVIGQFTVGPALAAGRFEARTLLRLPFVYVMILSIALQIWEIRPPAWLTNTTDLAGAIAVPMMLLSLGVALAQLKVARFGRATVLSLARIGGGGLTGWAVAAAFGLAGPARGAPIIESAMPVAVFNYLFASLYGNEPEEVAGMILVSTALAYVGLPFLIAALM